MFTSWSHFIEKYTYNSHIIILDGHCNLNSDRLDSPLPHQFHQFINIDIKCCESITKTNSYY